MDVLFFHAGNVGVNGIGIVVLFHVHLDLHLGLPFEGNRAHEKALEQVIDILKRIDTGQAEWVVTGKLAHGFLRIK